MEVASLQIKATDQVKDDLYPPTSQIFSLDYSCCCDRKNGKGNVVLNVYIVNI